MLVSTLAISASACSSGGDNVASADAAAGTSTTVAVATTPAPTTTVPAPICTVAAQVGDSLTAIAERNGLTLEQLEAENLLDPTDVFLPGQEFDVCIGDAVDPSDPTLIEPPPDAVMVQQRELNELFANTSLQPLQIDGDSGKLTRQMICAARMALGLPVHNRHLVPGSEEEATIFAATAIGIPEGAPIDADKWLLVDQTCQVIFTGEGNDRVVDVFPTSTGSEGHETFNVRAQAFRFDPAIDNDGWHDSESYPVSVDNPLNGNMYKPIYFNDGQAIHGAEFIPPYPRSKGCARTFPKHQDAIIEWLGLQDMTEATWKAQDIGLAVLVRGRYVDLLADA
ncbi:MAG: L,D-transpeptidase family protein [Acidimicrobiales bacterium]